MELFLAQKPYRKQHHFTSAYQTQMQTPTNLYTSHAKTSHAAGPQQHGREVEHASAASKDTGSALPLRPIWLFRRALHSVGSSLILSSVSLGRGPCKIRLQSECVSRSEYATASVSSSPSDSCINRTSSLRLMRWKKYSQQGHSRLQTLWTTIPPHGSIIGPLLPTKASAAAGPLKTPAFLLFK